jgi:hypothetical protein
VAELYGLVQLEARPLTDATSIPFRKKVIELVTGRNRRPESRPTS